MKVAKFQITLRREKNDFNVTKKSLQVLAFLAIGSVNAEPPKFHYGLPEISSEYIQAPSFAHGSGNTEYIEQHVGHQTSEGIHIDPHLLHKIERVLVQHENAGASSLNVHSPQVTYGVPQSTYGVPSHWSLSKVVGINFDHAHQSNQIAQYLGKARYATGWTTPVSFGWSSPQGKLVSQSGWSFGSSLSSLPSVSVSKPSGWIQAAYLEKPTVSYEFPIKPAAWTIQKPSSNYGVPTRW